MIGNLIKIIWCVLYDMWWFGLEAYTQKITHNCYECSTIAAKYNEKKRLVV